MNANRKKWTLGLAGLGIAGALVGGVGVAAAATGTPDAPGRGPTATSMPCRDDDGDFGGMHGMAYGRGTGFAAAAKYLGLSQAQLRTQLHIGKSLAELAAARGKTASGLKDAMVAAVRAQLRENTRLTQQQRSALLERLRDRVDAMVNATHEPGSGTGLRMGGAGDPDRMGRMGGGMRGMGW
jgi:hypothetical protein